jgi:hypothetical protein
LPVFPACPREQVQASGFGFAQAVQNLPLLPVLPHEHFHAA